MAFEKTIAALDLGTKTFKLLIAQKDSKKGRIKIIGQFEKDSAGMRRGRVNDEEEVTERIKDLLLEARKFTNLRLKSVFVGVNGAHINSLISHGSVAVSRADGMISQQDVERVIEVSKNTKIPSNREIIDFYPLEFNVDGEKGIKDPIGMKGIKLEVKTLLILAFSPYLKRLKEAVLGSGLGIEEIILSPLAGAKAVLTKQQKELGVAFLDIGAGVSSMAVFEEGDLIDIFIFPMGSDDITNDIARGLRCDISLAERIKKEYVFNPKFERKKGKIKISGEEETISFYPKAVNKIVQARLSEIFELANKELKRISRQGLLPGGIVISGGGAKLPRVVEIAKKELRLPTRIGVPKSFSNFTKDPRWSVAAGLILEGWEGGSSNISLGIEGVIEKLKKFFRIFIP